MSQQALDDVETAAGTEFACGSFEKNGGFHSENGGFNSNDMSVFGGV